MEPSVILTQICIVVHDAHQAAKHWSRVLSLPEAPVVTIFPEGIEHVTHGKPATYSDLQVALYKLPNLVIELMQPGEGPSPWRDFLDRNGQGVFHACLAMEDNTAVLETLAEMGVPETYHVGRFGAGSYRYAACADQLGIELSINSKGGQP